MGFQKPHALVLRVSIANNSRLHFSAAFVLSFLSSVLLYVICHIERS